MITNLAIEGMSCGHCVAAVKSALESVQGVKGAKVSLEEGSATVEHDGGSTPEAMIAAVEEEGYKAQAQG